MANAPVSSIRLTADSTWWIAALSKMTTLLGFIPLKGSNWGCRYLSVNSQDFSPFTLLIVICTSITPSTQIAAMAENQFPLIKVLSAIARVPLSE